MTKIPEAARRLGVAEAALRAWFARAPEHGLGHMEGKARVFDDDELVILAVWAALIRGGCGPPHQALVTAKCIARMQCETAYAPTDGAAITEDPPTCTAVAVPLAAIRQRMGSNELNRKTMKNSSSTVRP